ncbi:putative disease resistance protein [Carex littledalei]|uniref:Putative disease resistance protein n=1 Tax=Carex littledalei TaxID=544730 RepID=A0A833RIU6_9POAL|nr:putative disease resistance protein [Carex littledalei]
MAETVVDFVCQKLQDALTGPVKDALFQEGLSLYGVEDKVSTVQRELGRIKSFLRDADSKSSVSGEARVQNWVKEAEVDCINYKEPGIINSMKRFFKKPMLLPALHTLSSEMDDAQTRIKEITESRLTVGVTSLDEGSSVRSKPPIRRLILPDIGEMEMEVVGFESDKANIIGRLLDEHTSRRSVVSIVGPGGIGKTTLAQTVYNNDEVKRRFEILICVTFGNGRHTWLENLISLRHLEFRKCELENDTLPEKIGSLHCLEYLDLTDTKIVSLPESINEALNIVGYRVECKS